MTERNLNVFVHRVSWEQLVLNVSTIFLIKSVNSNHANMLSYFLVKINFHEDLKNLNLYKIYHCICINICIFYITFYYIQISSLGKIRIFWKIYDYIFYFFFKAYQRYYLKSSCMVFRNLCNNLYTSSLDYLCSFKSFSALLVGSSSTFYFKAS